MATSTETPTPPLKKRKPTRSYLYDIAVLTIALVCFVGALTQQSARADGPAPASKALIDSQTCIAVSKLQHSDAVGPSEVMRAGDAVVNMYTLLRADDAELSPQEQHDARIGRISALRSFAILLYMLLEPSERAVVDRVTQNIVTNAMERMHGTPREATR